MSCEHSCARAACMRTCHHHVCNVGESHFESLGSVAAVDADADVHAEIVGPSADDDTRKNVVKWRERHWKRSVLVLQIFSAT